MDNKEKSPEQELIESIGLMIEKGVESNTNIYTGVVKGVDGKRAVVTVNGRDQNVAIATADVSSGNVVKVFVPSNNMSAAFIIKAESSGGGGGTTTNYGDLTNKPSINGNTLIGNKTSAQIGVYGTGNPPPYPVTSVNGQTGDVTIEAGGNVDSVNGKTGVVVLNKSDIGLGNVDNVKQYSASNPPPYPVTSVDGATGAVVTNAVKTTAQALGNDQKAQARINIGAGTSNFSGSYDDLTNKPTIPDPYTLPVASSTTLGGVKPVAKTSDMTQSVGVDANGALYTAPGGGGTDDDTVLLKNLNTTGIQAQSIAYGYNTFVACGDNGKVAVSADGASWSVVDTGVTNALSSIFYGDGAFIAVPSTKNTLVYAEGYNTSKWKQVTLPTTTAGNWFTGAYGNNKFVVISELGDCAYSTNLTTWTKTTLPAISAGIWYKVVYGGGKFVAITSYDNKVAYSTDGTTWTAATLPSSQDWSDITYGNGKFVAVNNTSTLSAYSTDGITWTEITLQAFAVTYGNDRFIAIRNNYVSYSTDGINWTTSTIQDISAIDVAYGNNKFVAVNVGGEFFVSTDNGISWQSSVNRLQYPNGTDIHQQIKDALEIEDPDYPVTSVNGKTGAVVLNKSDVGLSQVANVRQYSEKNPPPYPVTSVNGKTGDVVVEGAQILVDGILEGDGTGKIFAAQTVQAETADAQVLPTVTTSDNGKFLRVVSGQWQAATILDANGQSF